MNNASCNANIFAHELLR